ncbi:Hypothetical protein NTJ_12123 [Nesidiocoris tenuis]|uniref:Uncharacterized protein n=1 Tax=Nesidiocoris tenuis TaxID=355587 RepID=A0ABN7B4G6_9HEMI|nr:Hypothetical protein NTJ_12123 [Nesidiocoris tenuis]
MRCLDAHPLDLGMQISSARYKTKRESEEPPLPSESPLFLSADNRQFPTDALSISMARIIFKIRALRLVIFSSFSSVLTWFICGGKNVENI